MNLAGINDGSLFGPGYVARYIQSGVVHTAGEGLTDLQNPRLTGRAFQDFINQSLWGMQLDKIISSVKSKNALVKNKVKE